MIQLTSGNSAPVGSSSQTTIVSPIDGMIVGIDLSIIGITGAGQVQAEVSASSEITVPSTVFAPQRLTHISVVSPGHFSRFVPQRIKIAAGQPIYLNVYSSVVGNYVHCSIHIAEPEDYLPKSGHVTQVIKEDLKPKITAGKLDQAQLRALNSIALTGRGALEACSDVIGDILNAAAAIASEGIYWLTALDLAQQNVDLSASRMSDLLGLWSTGGIAPLIKEMGPIGRGQIETSGYGRPGFPGLPPLEPLEKTALDYALVAVLTRALPQNSPRIRVEQKVRKRIDDKVRSPV